MPFTAHLPGLVLATALLALSVPALPAPAAAQAYTAVAEGATVRLAALQARALEHNPELRALRALAEAVGVVVSEAGTLPDPELALGAMNLGLPEFDNGMAASMLPSVQLSQRLPFFGKLNLGEAMAQADSARARLAVEEAEWRIRAEVARRFHALWALDRQLTVHRRTLDLLGDFQSVARAQYASGSGQQGDIIRADVEVGRMDADIQRLEALRATEAAALNALLDRGGAVDPGEPILPALPDSLPPLPPLLDWAMESRPALQGESVKVDRARLAVRLAEKDFWPDFTVTAQYGRRGGSDPRSMGGLMVGASIPIHAGSRQRPRLEAARAGERRAMAERDGARARVEAELRTVMAEARRARSLMRLYRDEILPAAQANVASSLASYRVGSVDFATLVDAQLAVDRYEQDYYSLVADYGTAVSLLEAAVGRPIPGSASSFDPSSRETPSPRAP